MKAIFFATPAKFRKWLEKHYPKETELIVGFYKVDSGKPSITWSQSVDQALCFGWIDGVRRSIDEESYCIRFTPRRPNSIWSAINIKKVEELRVAGLMTPAGEKAFAFLDKEKAGIYSNENEPVRFPPTFEKQFRKDKTAWTFFQAEAPSYKRIMIHWVTSAKQEKTRLSRLEKTISISAQHKRMM